MAKTDPFLLEGTNQQAVLLLHTLGGDPSEMRKLGKHLNKEGYTVQCPLYPGHGGTFAEMIATEVPQWYDAVLAVYDELAQSYQDIYVLGMSIGGTFAVKLAQDRDVKGLITVNAPIIGFDLYTDLFQFSQKTEDKDMIKRYRDYRYNYFHFVTELGQIANLQKITCPIFVLQGSKDDNRYKTSSMMLMDYPKTDIHQRRDYANSKHFLLLEADRKQAFEDILDFINQN